jgi:hypothetical protein
MDARTQVVDEEVVEAEVEDVAARKRIEVVTVGYEGVVRPLADAL